MRSTPKPKVKIGDRFQENDKRFFRVVEVVDVKNDRAQLKTLIPHGQPRLTWAKLTRFFKYSSTNYRFLGGRCHDCQIEAGAVVPRHGHRGITISMGTCKACLKPDVGLVPSCDYDWPKEGRKAIWD